MKKILSTILGLTLSATLFVGCSTNSDKEVIPEPTAPIENADGTKEFENKELSIAIFQGGYGEAYWNQLITNFEEAYPGVKVNMNLNPQIGEIIKPQIIGGNVPDFMSISENEPSGLIKSMIKERLLMDITDVFDSKAIDRDETIRDIIVPGMLEGSHFTPYGDGRIHLAPFNYGPMGFIYNKALFEQKGWELPETWDEFFALGEELDKEENYLVNADGSKTKRALFTYQGIHPTYIEQVLFPAIASAGGMEVIEQMGRYEEGSFSTPEVIKVLDMFKRISEEGHLMEGTVALNHTQSQADMMMGKSLFIVNGVWMEDEMSESPREEGFEFGMMAPPVFNEGDTRYVMTSYEQFSIPEKAKNPELAKEFLKFIYTEESIKLFAETANAVMATTDAKEISKPFITPATYSFFDVMDTSQSMNPSWDALPKGSKVNVFDEIFNNSMTPIMNGTMTTAEWAANVEKAFAQVREELAAEK